MKEIDLSQRLKALSDPTRLRILRLLEDEELAVGELTLVLGMTQSRVSGHLGILREAGFVHDRRQGTSAYYSLAETGEAVGTWKAVRPTLPATEEGGRDRRRLTAMRLRRRERAREFFDRAAASWDAGRSESLGQHAGLLAVAGLLRWDTAVLDLGTGTGGLLPLLARHAGSLLAVDQSRAMLERARRRAAAAKVAATFVQGDVEELPFRSASVAGVVANMILHHVPRPDRVLRETARVLRPGGRGVVVELAAHEERWLLEEEGHRWAGFDPAQIAGWCVDAGFDIPEFEGVATPRHGRWANLDVFVARFTRSPRDPETGR